MNIPLLPPLNNTVKRDITVEMLKFPADHSLDDKTASAAANFRATTSNLSLVSSHIQSLSKPVVNIRSNSLCVRGFALLNVKLSIARIIKIGSEAASTF